MKNFFLSFFPSLFFFPLHSIQLILYNTASLTAAALSACLFQGSCQFFYVRMTESSYVRQLKCSI